MACGLAFGVRPEKRKKAFEEGVVPMKMHFFLETTLFGLARLELGLRIVLG